MPEDAPKAFRPRTEPKTMNRVLTSGDAAEYAARQSVQSQRTMYERPGAAARLGISFAVSA